MKTTTTPARLLLGMSVVALSATSFGAAAQDAHIVQPGAPGQASRLLTPVEAAKIAENRYSPDDVRFMQDMILHHHQAVQMADLVKGRTNNKALVDAAGRIDASQADEIAFMRNWLIERGQKAPDPANDPHAMHHGKDHSTMAGMATPEQMKELAKAKGQDFDRLFLKLMIAHHEGAVKMVSELLEKPGSAYDPALHEFINDVNNEQKSEIRRMAVMSRELSDDPRSTLAAGFRDAGQAISNLNLVASLPKPAGFFDPENPADLPPPVDEKADKAKEGEDEFEDDEEETDPNKPGNRAPFRAFSNTDMAFSGDLMAAGNYHGFNLYRIGDKGVPKLITSVVCPGGQGDVSIVGDLLLMSVEQTSGRVDCGRQGVAEDVSPERFRGLRVFDISNPLQPVQVGQVQTCRGSHTHSVVTADDNRIIVYNSGTSSIRDEKELAGCVGDVAGDDRTALFRVDVIEIPVADPSKSRIISSPTVFADPESGRIAGLWQGGDHGKGSQTTARTDHCHDITVFPSRKLAGGACSGNGLIFDISNPLEPKRIDAVGDPGFAYWHSATFNNDGTKVLFTDEWGGGGRPRCRVQDPMTWGANAIYDIVDGKKLEFRSYYKLPASQTAQENCVAHNGSIIPVPGRDIFVQAWYQGGISIMDFTDSANPVEIAYFDRGPLDAKHMVLGGYWSVYWYGGYIYGTEIVRGLDILELAPSEYLTEAEIAAARLADQGNTFNPQQQFPVTWPAHPVVARAYVDQLQRSNALSSRMAADLIAALDEAKASVEAKAGNAALASKLEGFAKALKADGKDALASRRLTALQQTLSGVAATLR
jgi:uncharacterized protein (DUF305 family)